MMMSDFKQILNSATDFRKKNPNITFRKNPSSASRADAFGQKDAQETRN
jgi:hypothetical protein